MIDEREAAARPRVDYSERLDAFIILDGDEPRRDGYGYPITYESHLLATEALQDAAEAELYRQRRV